MRKHLHPALVGILALVALSACARLPPPTVTPGPPTPAIAAPTATLAQPAAVTPTTAPDPTATHTATPRPPTDTPLPATPTGAASTPAPAAVACPPPTDDYPAQLEALLDYAQAQGLPAAVLQVDLARHPKVSQYRPEITAAYGFNACGLVAAGAALGGSDWVAATDRIRTASGDAYAAESGIQPSPYAGALRRVLGRASVREENAWTLCALVEALQQGEVVIVDIQVGSRLNEPPEWPTTAPPNYAHFARVLGVDVGQQRIYIENTLGGEAAYWDLSLAQFWAVWIHPEIAVSVRAPNPEDVTRWAVVLRAPGAPIASGAPGAGRRNTREPYG